MSDAEAKNFDGWTARWLGHARGRFAESFDLVVSDLREFESAALHENARLVDFQRFHDQPKLGPAVIYRRVISEAPGSFDVSAYFQGNLASDSTAEPELVDARGSQLMSDARFWSLLSKVDLLGKEDGLDLLADALAAAGVSETMGFANTLAAKLRALDHPLNANEDPDVIETEADEASLDLRCWAVARGRDDFDALEASPGSVRWAPEMRRGFDLLQAAPTALSKLSGRQTLIRTRDDYSTRSNVGFWGELPERHTPNRPRNENENDDEVDPLARWYAAHTPSLLQKLYGGPDPIWDEAAGRAARFHSARVIVVGDKVEELVVLVSAPRLDSELQVASRIREHLPIASGAQIIELEVMDTRRPRLVRGADHPMPSIFRILRKSRLTEGAYMQRYHLESLAPN